MYLIVGGDSEIGAAAYRAMRARGRKIAATTRRGDRVDPDRPFLDLSASLDAWEPPPGTEVACICAAIARMAACATDPAGTAYINVDRTLALIDKLLMRGIHVLFLSTNQVFDGRVAYAPAEAAYSPVSEYGGQKARTEIALRHRMARGAPLAVLRLAKVVSPRMPLIDRWVADLSANKPISVFNDMMLAPTPTDLVCSAIGALMEDRATGIFQLTGPRDVAYSEVARFLAAHLGASTALVKEASARSAGLPKGATPRNTTLDSRPICDRYGFEVPDVWQVIEDIIAIGAKQ
ncbi:MAG: sugar nucleotide-binding protein [Beijerinckiaceae bacterium]|jgi:dTDP-4-dehydrorhamnose reductase